MSESIGSCKFLSQKARILRMFGSKEDPQPTKFERRPRKAKL